MIPILPKPMVEALSRGREVRKARNEKNKTKYVHELVQQLGRVGLSASGDEELVAPALGVLAGGALETDVKTRRPRRIATALSRPGELVNTVRDVGDLAEVDGVDRDLGVVLLDLVLEVLKPPCVVVDRNEVGGVLESRPLTGHETVARRG